MIISLKVNACYIESGSSSRKVSHKWLAILRENNGSNDRNNASSPQNNSNCFARGLVVLQAYNSCYTSGYIPSIIKDLKSRKHFQLCCNNFVVKQTNFFFDLTARIPPDPTIFEQCCVSSQGCLLLLYLKQHLKEMYGFSDRYEVIEELYKFCVSHLSCFSQANSKVALERNFA